MFHFALIVLLLMLVTGISFTRLAKGIARLLLWAIAGVLLTWVFVKLPDVIPISKHVWGWILLVFAGLIMLLRIIYGGKFADEAKQAAKRDEIYRAAGMDVKGPLRDRR